MKLSKSKLKQIILEEFEALSESKNVNVQGQRTGADARKDALGDAAAQAVQGITGQERFVMKQILDLLADGARDGNILSGNVMTRIDQLAATLRQLIDEPAADTPKTGGIN